VALLLQILRVMFKVGVMPVGRPPHMYHNGIPNQMQMMPNAVNLYPPTSSTVPRADGVAVSSESWSDASSKLAASSAAAVSDHRPVRIHDLMSLTQQTHRLVVTTTAQ